MAVVGLPGIIYTPEAGSDLPGIAFGHGWLTHSRQYIGTLEHLASWGIVVAVPDTERGPFASDRALARSVKDVHEVTANALAIIAALHAAAALVHHWVLRDRTLLRMLPLGWRS